jgi:hypothetical protein
MSNLNDYYKDDDPRNKQPEVPELEKCANCGLMFEESTMVTDASEDNLFCSHECSEKYWTI